jgi:hypothetical protein
VRADSNDATAAIGLAVLVGLEEEVHATGRPTVAATGRLQTPGAAHSVLEVIE